MIQQRVTVQNYNLPQLTNCLCMVQQWITDWNYNLYSLYMAFIWHSNASQFRTTICYSLYMAFIWQSNASQFRTTICYRQQNPCACYTTTHHSSESQLLRVPLYGAATCYYNWQSMNYPLYNAAPMWQFVANCHKVWLNISMQVESEVRFRWSGWFFRAQTIHCHRHPVGHGKQGLFKVPAAREMPYYSCVGSC